MKTQDRYSLLVSISVSKLNLASVVLLYAATTVFWGMIFNYIVIHRTFIKLFLDILKSETTAFKTKHELVETIQFRNLMIIT